MTSKRCAAPMSAVAGLLSVAIHGANAGELDDLLAQYATVQSATISASVQINLISGGGATECCGTLVTVPANDPIEGDFWYVVDGDQWRMESFMDPARYPGMDTALLFDGAQFAYLARDTGVMGIEQGAPPASLGMTLQNPLFEPLQFLFPIDDANELGQIQLTDAWEKAATTDLSNVQWDPVFVEGRHMHAATFPGAVYNGVPYQHHVYAPTDDHPRPTFIDRVDENANVVTRTKLLHYESVVSENGQLITWWPRRISWDVFDSQGQLVVQMSMIIEEVSVNDPQSIPADAFDVQALQAQAQTVVVDGVVQP